jgi:hypothetical protein
VPHNPGVEFQDDGQVYSPLGPCNKNLGLSAFELQLGTVAGGQAHVTFTLPEDAFVDVTVFDLAGRRLATLENSQLPMGVYERVWNMEGVSDGLYYVRMRTGKVSLTKTLLKVR